MKLRFYPWYVPAFLLVGVLSVSLWGVGEPNALAAAKPSDAFKMADIDNDGLLTAEEAEAAQISLEVFKSVDLNQDGKVDADEYALACPGELTKMIP